MKLPKRLLEPPRKGCLCFQCSLRRARWGRYLKAKTTAKK